MDITLNFIFILGGEKVLNIAILGAGVMGRVHSNSYHNIMDSRVVAVCDIDGQKAEEIAKNHNAKVYTDFEMMFEKDNIDIVDICLPTYLHKEYAVRAMKRKKHVFCEKPIALSADDAKMMMQEALSMKVKFSVGHVVRYFPAYSNAARLIADGKIGEPKLIRTTRTGAYPLWCWQNWYSDDNLSGGIMLDLVIHDFDWIRHNFGDIERVYAKNIYYSKNKDKSQRADHCLIVLRLKNGAIAHVEGSWAYPSGSIFGTAFEVVGTKGQIEFDSRESAPVKKHIYDDGTAKIISFNPLSSSEEPYTRELENFINCINGDTEPDVSAEDAVKALNVSLAAIKSSKTGAAITVGGREHEEN